MAMKSRTNEAPWLNSRTNEESWRNSRIKEVAAPDPPLPGQLTITQLFSDIDEVKEITERKEAHEAD